MLVCVSLSLCSPQVLTAWSENSEWKYQFWSVYFYLVPGCLWSETIQPQNTEHLTEVETFKIRLDASLSQILSFRVSTRLFASWLAVASPGKVYFTVNLNKRVKSTHAGISNSVCVSAVVPISGSNLHVFCTEFTFPQTFDTQFRTADQWQNSFYLY